MFFWFSFLPQRNIVGKNTIAVWWKREANRIKIMANIRFLFCIDSSAKRQIAIAKACLKAYKNMPKEPKHR